MFSHLRAAQPEFASQRTRRRWADCVNRLLREADRTPDRLHPRGITPIYDRQVIVACSPALREIRDVLLDETVDVRTSDLKELKTLMCEGAVSPLMRRNVAAARGGTDEVLDRFNGSPAARSARSDAVPTSERWVPTQPRAAGRR
jgi:hypothetical protein